MSMEYLLLGCLNQGAQSGYDLHKLLGDSLEKGWNTDRRQIYYLLHKMEKNGWLEVEVIPQEDNPNKKVYHITSQGQAALRTWIKTPQKGESAPFNWMGQLFLGYEVAVSDIIHILEQRCVHLEERLAAGSAYADELQRVFASGEEVTLKMLYRVLSLHHGFTYTTSELQWARQAIELLSALDKDVLQPGEIVTQLLSQLSAMGTSNQGL